MLNYIDTLSKSGDKHHAFMLACFLPFRAFNKFQFLFNVTFLVTVYYTKAHTEIALVNTYISNRYSYLRYSLCQPNHSQSNGNDVMMKINLPTSPLLGIFTFPTP